MARAGNGQDVKSQGHTNQSTDFEAWRLRKKKFNELLSKCRKHTKCIEDEVVKSENLGAFYKYINKRTSYRPAIGALTDDVEISKPTIMIKQNYLIVIFLQSVW